MSTVSLVTDTLGRKFVGEGIVNGVDPSIGKKLRRFAARGVGDGAKNPPLVGDIDELKLDGGDAAFERLGGIMLKLSVVENLMSIVGDFCESTTGTDFCARRVSIFGGIGGIGGEVVGMLGEDL